MRRKKGVLGAAYNTVIAAPHEFLTRHFSWYRRLTLGKSGFRAHSLLVSCYAILLVGLVFGVYRAALAAPDLFDDWDFSTPASFSFDSGVEANGSTARLKAQNYTSDANTMALYHLDESSGGTAADSSTNGNDGTVTNATFGTGNLNNGLDFNGTTSQVNVPDSASLSLSQQNSLEAWVKFDSAFSAGSADQYQTILNKGDYQLYFDNETGKLTYELADGNASGWTQQGGNDLNGGWDLNGKRSVNAISKMGSNFYYAIGADVGDAEVWRWNGSSWTIIGGGPNSVNSSWAAQTFEGVYALANDGTNLYAALGVTAGDAEVWRFNGTSWTKIGGDAVNSSWQVNTFEQVWALTYFGGTLYAGVGSSANDAEVWSWNGTSWTKIGGDSLNSGWTTNYEIVASLTNDGTNLYAALGTTAGDGEVWRWNGTSWTKIGGDGVNSGWDATIETVRTLRYFGSTLYAGLGDSAGDADVWSWNGATWTQIGGDGLNSSWAAATYEQVGALDWDGTNLYAGLGTGNGDGEAWMYDGASWTKIGGDGLNGGWTTAQGDIVNALSFDSGTLHAGTFDSAGAGQAWTWDGASWTQIGGDYVNQSWGFFGFSAVQVMQNIGPYMYAGMGNTAGAAVVMRFDGTTWEVVGGQGVNGSWTQNTYEQITSMASYNGHLFVGLGTTANDAEVWEFDGATWTQVGGDSLNSGWTTNFEEVNSMASDGGYLYVGLGNSNNDAEVWRWNDTIWEKVGGDSLNSGWTTNYDRVASLAVYEGDIVAGLGAASGEAEVWSFNGSTWTKIGGDTVGGSWALTGYEQVEALAVYDGKLYAGLGNTTDDAELWEYDGTTWTQIGGDDINSSWTAGTYERVKTIAVYNGDLYAGLGTTAGDGEVWRLSGGTWTKIGGNSLNGGWGNTIEQVESMSAYRGKFYVGTGATANADANVWSWGNNAFLQSTTNSFDTNWHHVAATYDGATLRLYVDGTLDSSTAANISLPDSSRALLIGQGYGGREYGKPLSAFEGMLDEIRISNIARSSFTTNPYPTDPQTVTLNSAVRTDGVWHWDDFITDETTNGGTITYRLSDDNGTTWKYWNGSGWVASASTSESNPVATVDTNIATFPATFQGIKWQAVLSGNGDQRVTLNSLSLQSTSDTTAPSSATVSIGAERVNGGAVLNENDWTNGGSPYFSWTTGTDTESGVKGYCAYIGTDNGADPVTTKGMLGATPVATGGFCQYVVGSAELDLGTPGALATALTSNNSPYYLILKTIDNAGNVSADSASFHFRFDNTPANNPGFVTAPSGFVNNKAVTMTWPTVGGSAPSDDHSGFVGMQYRIGASGTWYGDSHTGAGDINDLLTNDGSYTTVDPPDFDDLQEGINTVYFRSWDTAGNVTTTYTTATIKINTAGAPSEPQNVIATPSTNTTNAFAFSWDAPVTFVGDENNLTYCYTINTIPSASNCTFTSAGVTSLGSGPYATQPGINTFYVVARDESSNINYASFTSVEFTANTTAPGLPLNIDIVDVSIKSTNNWRLAITWDEPSVTGSGVASYRVWRSTDDVNFAQVGSSSSTTYIDAGLTQQLYYYKISACDNTNNCGALTNSASETPTGKFTSPATLVADPVVSDITTKRATITWSTDRASDSKVAIGTSSGTYSSSEIGNSAQVSAHSISLDNLSAGTTYYFVAKWTDEDGNTGQSSEFVFTTLPPPSLKEVETTFVSLNSAKVQFTSKDASKVSLLYGKSEGFGGIQTINTSTIESTYTVDLPELEDGTKYFFKLTSYDTEDNSYDTSVFSFTTPPRPRITNLRFQPVEGEPTSTQRVTWTTNVPSTSSVTYGKVDNPGVESVAPELVTAHEITIRNLEDDSEYFLLAQSRDADGNLATSDRQVFHTALDTRPPRISGITIESSIRGTGSEARGQVIVSWRTDELSTSQVAYTEGSGATIFNNRTAEDQALSFEHIVVISDLPTSKVYSVQPVSRDKSGNAGEGQAQSAIIGRATDNVLTIVLNSLRRVFGF